MLRSRGTIVGWYFNVEEIGEAFRLIVQRCFDGEDSYDLFIAGKLIRNPEICEKVNSGTELAKIFYFQ